MLNLKIVLLVLSVVLFSPGLGLAYEEDITQKSVKGKITEIAEDGSYILIDDLKIFTSENFLINSYFEVGDNVEITAENTTQGLQALDYEYIFDDDESIYVIEEDSVSEEEDSVSEEELTY